MDTRVSGLALSLCIALSAPAALNGCNDASAQQPQRITASDLACADLDPTLDMWESAGWAGATCDWLRFDGGTTVEIEHPLGRAPKMVIPYIAFTADGAGATVSSGDTTLIGGADDTIITLSNTTAQRFYLRVVAQ